MLFTSNQILIAYYIFVAEQTTFIIVNSYCF